MKGSKFWNSWAGRGVAAVGFLAAVATLVSTGIAVWQIIPHPPALATCQGFSDNFLGASLNSRWRRVSLAPSTPSTYSLASGTLQLTAPTGADLYKTVDFSAPRILQNVSGNFSIETTVELHPIANQDHPNPVTGALEAYQGAGLVIWESDSAYIRLEQGFRSDSHEVYLLGVADGILTINRMVIDPQVSLELRRSGDDFFASWTGDDGAIHALGAVHAHFTTMQVGLLLVNNSGNPPTVFNSASFADFTLTCG